MTHRYWSLAFAALSLVAVPLQAQYIQTIPETLQQEEEEFADAMRAIESDPYEVASIERFLRRHPASRYAAEAQLAYERARLITKGDYDAPYMVEPLQLHQIRPSRQYLQSFYDGQQQLNALVKGEQVSIEKLKLGYQLLAADGDDNYLHEAEYYAGYCEYAQGHFAAADSLFAHLGKTEKYEPSLSYYRMQIAYVQGNIEEAMQRASQLRQSKKRLTDDQLNELTRVEAECLMANGQNAAALEKFDEYLAKADERHIVPVSAYNAAVLAYKNNHKELLMKALPQAVKATDPVARQQAYFLLGKTYVEQKDYAKAQMAYHQAAQIQDGNAQVTEAAAYNRLSCVHETTQSPWGDEVALLEQFLNTYPESAYNERVSSYLNDTYMTTQNYADALASIDRIKQPTTAILKAKQRLYTQQGLMAFVNAGYTDAVTAFDQSIAMGTVDPKYYEQSCYWRGESLYRLQQYDLACQQLLAFNDLKATDNALQALAYYTLGYTRMKQSDWDKAIVNFERFVALPGQRGSDYYCDVMYRMGECYYNKRAFQQAESYYHDAAQSTADVNLAARAIYQIAILRGVQKRYEDKQKSLDELISTYPTSDWADDADLEKGRNFTLQLKYAAAIETFQHVIQHYPQSECARKALLEMAMAYNNLGKYDLALMTYKQVIEQYPGGDEAQIAASDLKAIYLERNDINGYANYAAEHNLEDQLSVGQRDSLNLIAANRVLEEGNTNEAIQRYKELLATTNNDAIRRQILPVLLPLAYNQKNAVLVKQCYQQIIAIGGMSNTEVTEAQLLAALVTLDQGEEKEGLELLNEAAADIRTAAGAEAKYQLAKYLYDHQRYDAAEATIQDMLSKSTPHVYWMQRSVIVLSDVLTQKNDILMAQEYLKQLKETKDLPADIESAISKRLKK